MTLPTEPYIEISGGLEAKQKWVLAGHRRVTVGNTENADITLPDEALAALHFAIERIPGGYRIRDLGSPRGTYLNGTRVNMAPLQDQDWIVAGFTHFVVYLPASDYKTIFKVPGNLPINTPSLSPIQSTLLAFLHQQEPLYAILDAARDFRALEYLRASEVRFVNLFQGPKAQELAPFAPYLTTLLTPKTELLEILVREGWGQSWGIYVTCCEPFEVLLHQLRELVWIGTPEGLMYFRFQDPRVLREFLPTCKAQTAHEFFGPIESFLMESEKPDQILQFSLGSQGIHRGLITLDPQWTKTDRPDASSVVTVGENSDVQDRS